MKKIMLLGGNLIQMTCTQAAKAEGYYVISVDYLPDNPAHKLADKYYNISTVDKEAVLEVARAEQIDGIVSYASDVSAPTAAYVAEAMGLPGNPYDSVMILTQKDRFRAFLEENGFAVPGGRGFTDREAAEAYYHELKGTVMVKPVDSSGSKGVCKVSSEEEFAAAWEEALKYSREKRVIVEQFIQRDGYQIDGDIFVEDGEIRFWGICDQHHDDAVSEFVPAGLSYPSVQKPEIQEKAKEIIGRILRLLNMKMGAYNVEYIVAEDGQIYILEIGPRNGGNMIPDVIRAATGVDLACCTVRQAVGDDICDLIQKKPFTCASSYIFHAGNDGLFEGMEMEPEMRDCMVDLRMEVQPGTPVSAFRNAGFGLGTGVFTFNSIESMCNIIDHMNEHIRLKVSH